jgi:hypothetical protein
MPLHWLRQLADRTPAARRRRAFRPALEQLEARALLATFTVSNTNDSGAGSLRQALLDANGSAGLDTIAFTIPAGQTINLASPLPAITDPISLTAPSGTRLNGTGAGPSANGLMIDSSGSTVRGLTVSGFSGDGIRINGSNNVIGGTAVGQRNAITGNAGAGVYVAAGTGNSIRGNSIDANGGLGIDLAPAGVTPNDPHDTDSGPNNLQNFPLLTSVVNAGGQTRVTLTLNSTPGTAFAFDLYTSAAADPSGFGEGMTLRGSFTQSTDSCGNVTFQGIFTPALTPGTFFTATVTDPAGNTSEFSNAVLVPSNLLQFSAATIPVGEGDGTATITVTRSGDLSGTATVRYATADREALAGSDYTAASGTLTFGPGQAAATFLVAIAEDTVYEESERVQLILSNPTGLAGLDANGTASLTIVDNDAPLPGLDPSPRAQESLELLNRMRLNPQAELPLLLNAGDPDVDSAVCGFMVDQQLLAQQWSTLRPVPPLAWHPALITAALNHSQAMLAANMQTHQAPGEPALATRATTAGYTGFSILGENVYAFARSMFHAHAGFAIDWGFGPGGIQDPPGHRENMMSAAFREIGIGVIDGLPGRMTGPILITQDFGNRFALGDPYLLGVVYGDANGNGFYNQGEGKNGVSILISGPGGTFTTTTLSAGGYQRQVSAGTYTVTFSGGGLPAPITRTVTVGSQNVKLDVIVGDDPGQFQFSAASYSVAENAGQATITVTRSNGTAGGATVVLATGNGTATAGSDYTAVIRILTFGAGETSQTVTIPIRDDALHEGSETVNLTLSNPGGGATLGSPTSAVLTITDNDRLTVASFTPTSTGFVAQFNGLIDVTSLNLYDTNTGGLGPADTTLTGPSGAVAGSLIIDPSGTQVTFIATGGVLPAGSYSAVLRSAADAFKAQVDGELLDGNSDGTPGGDFAGTLALNPPVVVVSIPDFMRGPGQAVNVPAAATGLPLRLSEGSGVTRIELTFTYDPSLLTVTAAERGPALPPDTVLTISSVPGQWSIVLTTGIGLPAGPVDFVILTASVPDAAGARYTAKQVLDLSAVRVNGGAIAAADDDGVHVNAYFGDTSGNGTYSSVDATRALRVAVGLDTGFTAYQLADPLLIADITGNGTINATDATRILQAALGIPQAQIPPLPAGSPTITPAGPDPLLSIPKRFRARPGGIVTVPVNLDRSEGLESADLALAFDPARLEVVAVRRGRLTRDFDLFAVQRDNEAGTLTVALGHRAGPVSERGAGSLLQILVRIRPDAPAGPTVINLRQRLGTATTQLNEGGLDLNPDPSDEAGDPLDGRLVVRPQLRDRFFVSGSDVANLLAGRLLHRRRSE